MLADHSRIWRSRLPSRLTSFPLVPEVVIMGTGFHTFTNTFNMFFDPESARKVLRAAWPKCTLVTVDIAEEIHQRR